MKMYEKHQILRQRQITLKQIKCLTSSSLWFLMPRTKSCRFLSNIRSMLPFTIFRAIMLSLLSYRTEPQTRALCEHWPAARVLVSHSVPNSGLCRRAFALSVSADLAADQCRKWLTKWRTDHLTGKPIHTATRRDALWRFSVFMILTFES